MSKAILATPFSIALFLMGWSLTPVFVRYMSGAYDPYTQAFVRYLSAAAALCAYAYVFYRRDLFLAMRRWRTLAPIGAVVVCMQIAWTVAIYNTTATMAQLVTTLQAPTVILFSFIVFHEERDVIRSPFYIVGSLLCFLGVIAVFMRDDGEQVRFYVDFAMILLLFVSVAWAVYAVWGRHTAKGLHPVAMFTMISVYVTIGLFFAMCHVPVWEPRRPAACGAAHEQHRLYVRRYLYCIGPLWIPLCTGASWQRLLHHVTAADPLYHPCTGLCPLAG